jgi:two-component system cell cycle response regulator
MHNESLKSSFTKRYILAISLIAILSSITFYTLHVALKVSDSTALIVNISGKQRMLSQRIAALSEHYYLHLDKGTLDDAKRIKSSLKSAIDEMSEANHKLSTGALKKSVQVTLSEEIHELYFGKPLLKKRVENYLMLANKIIMSSNKEELYPLVHELTLESDTLLPTLHEAVVQYQKEGEENIAMIQQFETIAWLLTLFTLMLEVIFIFQPMAHKIQELFKELLEHKENLEHEIDRRTFTLEQANYKLQHLASHDPLTGLKNRLNLENDLENLIIHHAQHHIPFAVAMIDIDWFKRVNDNYGHDVGDRVLKEIAKILTENIRGEDSAYRAGGEEFVIIFNRIDERTAIQKIEALRQLIEKNPVDFSDQSLNVTISGGLYHPAWKKADSVQWILKLADEALYEAKRSGRNRIVAINQLSFTEQTHLPPSKIMIKCQREAPFAIVYADFDIIDILGYSNDVLTKGNIHWGEILYRDDIDFMVKLQQSCDFMTTLRISHPLGYVKIIKVECTLNEQLWKIEIQDPIALAKSVEDKMIIDNFEAMLNNTDDFIYFKDRYHVFTAGSKSLVALTNVDTKDDLVGKTDYEVFPREFADKYFDLEKQIFSGNIDVARDNHPYLDNDGKSGWVDNRKYPIKNSSGEIIGLFGVARILMDSNLVNKDAHV